MLSRMKTKWKFPRLMSYNYCKKTKCKNMGFTQKSSCRPYKNCYKTLNKTINKTIKKK